MNVIVMARLNLNHKFDTNVREAIRFQKNSLSTIKKQLEKLNQKVNCPKWSARIKSVGNNYYLEVVEQPNIAKKAFLNYRQLNDGKTPISIKVNDHNYTLTSSVIREKIRKNTLSETDINNHLNKNLKKIKTGIRAISDRYDFALADDFFDTKQNQPHSLSFA